MGYKEFRIIVYLGKFFISERLLWVPNTYNEKLLQKTYTYFDNCLRNMRILEYNNVWFFFFVYLMFVLTFGLVQVQLS